MGWKATEMVIEQEGRQGRFDWYIIAVLNVLAAVSLFLIEISDEPGIVCASLGPLSTPIYWHAPQKADPVRAEEPIS